MNSGLYILRVFNAWNVAALTTRIFSRWETITRPKFYLGLLHFNQIKKAQPNNGGPFLFNGKLNITNVSKI